MPPPTPNVFITRFGDTAGDLADHEHGGDQVVAGVNQVDGNYAIANSLYGDAEGALLDHAQGGNDTLVGAGLANGSYGDANLITDHARGGDDLLSTGPGVNIVYGDADTLSGHARGGNDIIRIDTFHMFTEVVGDSRVLEDHAKAGDDTLIDNSPTPVLMYGDAVTILGNHVQTGSDTFVFRPGASFATIADFEPGKDKIDLTAFAVSGFHSFDDIAPLIHPTGLNGADTAISFTVPNLSNITVLGDSHLTPNDFIFA